MFPKMNPLYFLIDIVQFFQRIKTPFKSRFVILYKIFFFQTHIKRWFYFIHSWIQSFNFKATFGTRFVAFYVNYRLASLTKQTGGVAFCKSASEAFVLIWSFFFLLFDRSKNFFFDNRAHTYIIWFQNAIIFWFLNLRFGWSSWFLWWV